MFDAAAARDIDLLVAVQGLRDDPLAAATAQRLGAKAQVLTLAGDGLRGTIALHAAQDPSDEAERAAACVLRHVREGRVPVALAAIDRMLTRRIRAMLDEAGAAIRDETGWKLSTTRAAAHAMLALRACMHGAGSDAVIDWLKNSPAHAPASVLSIETRLRRQGIREWRFVRAPDLREGSLAVFERVNAWRDSMREPRALPRWIAQLRTVLQESGQWRELEADAAGQQVIAALRLADLRREELEHFAPAQRRIELAVFIAWANDTLEAGNFR